VVKKFGVTTIPGSRSAAPRPVIVKFTLCIAANCSNDWLCA
jgi:hypothetical protein